MNPILRSVLSRSLGSRRSFSNGVVNGANNVGAASTTSTEMSVTPPFTPSLIATVMAYFVGGPLIYGDAVAKAEKRRKKKLVMIYGESVEFVELSPGVFESIVSLGKAIGQAVCSDLKENATDFWAKYSGRK